MNFIPFLKLSSKIQFVFLLPFFFPLTACMVPSENSPIQLSSLIRTTPAFVGRQELPFCSTRRTYDPPLVTFSGTAKYEKRKIYRDPGKLTGGLGAIAQPEPIRYAEVRVINTRTLEVEQCAETNQFGQFQFELPKSSDLFYVLITSRVQNKIAKASIMNSPIEKDFYSLKIKTRALENKRLGTHIATAKGKILGGAFHIMDRIIEANEFIEKEIKKPLKEDPTLLPSSFYEHLKNEKNHCLHKQTIPKVEVYWQPGVSTGSYLSSNSRNIGCQSFYLISAQGRLFLCGGEDGDIDHVDTDHYDPSIILHEYSHHINNFCSKIDSPSIGVHTGNAVVDPRLALEEGWANFFQAAVLNQPYYTDTEGTIEGHTGFRLNVPIDKVPEVCTEEPKRSGCDVPENPGEGNFREFSITRWMWSVFSRPSRFENGFFQIWSLLTSDFNYLSNEHAFRSIGLLHLLRDEVFSNSEPWETLREEHQHIGNRSEFALRLKESPTPCPMAFSIDPENVSDESYLLLNDNFYHLKMERDLSNVKLQMNYSNVNGYEADLDVYIYEEYKNIQLIEGIVGYSNEIPDRRTGTEESESILIPYLKKGHYLINLTTSVKEKAEGTNPGGLTRYEFLLNDQYLCTEEFIEENNEV